MGWCIRHDNRVGDLRLAWRMPEPVWRFFPPSPRPPVLPVSAGPSGHRGRSAGEGPADAWATNAEPLRSRHTREKAHAPAVRRAPAKRSPPDTGRHEVLGPTTLGTSTNLSRGGGKETKKPPQANPRTKARAREAAPAAPDKHSWRTGDGFLALVALCLGVSGISGAWFATQRKQLPWRKFQREWLCRCSGEAFVWPSVFSSRRFCDRGSWMSELAWGRVFVLEFLQDELDEPVED